MVRHVGKRGQILSVLLQNIFQRRTQQSDLPARSSTRTASSSILYRGYFQFQAGNDCGARRERGLKEE